MNKRVQASGMISFIRLITVCLAIVLLFSIQSCQVEDEIQSDFLESVSDEVNLKNATVTSADIDGLIKIINSMVAAGELESGIANSLIAKLENAKKSLENGNSKTAMNLFHAVENQLEDLMETDKISEVTGEILTSVIDVFNGEWSCGQPFVDLRDGNIYKTVKIGDQCWMAENLAYLPSVSPSSEGSYTTDPYYYVYDYQGTDVDAAKVTENYITYGVLYNWLAATHACPAGWQLPSDAEWQQLEKTLGMEQSQLDILGWRGTDQGTQLKAASGWDENGHGSNTSGFSALPGGTRNSNGTFTDVGKYGYWWSCTERPTIGFAWMRGLIYNSGSIYRYGYFNARGFSVRCIKL